MIKSSGLAVLLLGLFIVALFYWAMYWFHKNPDWQDQNVIYAREVLGKGFKVALNGIDWNQNNLPECIAYLPVKKLQKTAPHLQAIRALVVVENHKVLFSWSSKDTIAFIPLINSLEQTSIPTFFSTSLDSINTNEVFQLVFKDCFKFIKS